MNESQRHAKILLRLALQAEQEHLNTLIELTKRSQVNKIKYKDKIKALKESMLPKQTFFNKETEKGTDNPIPAEIHLILLRLCQSV